MGILGSVFNSFFDGIAIDILKGSKKSAESKISSETKPEPSVKTWASQFETNIEKDFTEYDWFDFYPTNDSNAVPCLHPESSIITDFYDGEEKNQTKQYLYYEKSALKNPYDTKAQCLFIQYCFILMAYGTDVRSTNREIRYDSQYAPGCLKLEKQLFEKIHRAIYNILEYGDNTNSGQAIKCSACIIDAQIYMYKGDLVKCLKRNYQALQYDVISSISYKYNTWNGLLCSVLSNIAGIYNFAGHNEKSVALFDTFRECVSQEKKNYRELMKGSIRGSEQNNQTWSDILNALNYPSSLGVQWTYFAGKLNELGTFYEVGNNGKGMPIYLRFSTMSMLDYVGGNNGDEWAKTQKEKLQEYISKQ